MFLQCILLSMYACCFSISSGDAKNTTDQVPPILVPSVVVPPILATIRDVKNTTDQVPPILVPSVVAPPSLSTIRCNGTKADIVFVLDMSSSVGPQNFDIMKSFVQAIVRVLSIGPDETRVGVITFSRYPHIPIHIHDYTNENDLIKAIDRIVYETGITETHSALILLEREGFQGLHRYVPKIGIVVTDGQSTHHSETIKAAQTVKASGITMFTVGIGSQITKEELNEIASSPTQEHVFLVSEFNKLLSIVSTVTEGTCGVEELNNTVPLNTTVMPPIQTTEELIGNENFTTDHCNRSVADIMFVLDSSGSLGDFNFRQLKKFVVDVTKALDISGNLTQVGVITFNNYPLLRIRLDRYHNKNELLNAISAIPYYPGNTETDKALDYLRLGGFIGGRDFAPNVAIVITDGKSYEKNLTKIAAEEVKKVGTTVFAIGIGDEIDTVELDAISSNPNSFFRFFVNNFTSLNNILTTVINNTCEVPVRLKLTTLATKTSSVPTTSITDTTTTVTTNSYLTTTSNNICVNKLADIMFVVDSSGSIGMDNFLKIKDFIKQTITIFDIGANSTRVGLITFNQQASLQFGLDKYNSSKDLQTAVDAIIYSQGGTNTGGALELLRRHGFTNERPGAPNIAIVITDGLSADPVATKQQASLIKQQGDTTLIAIGIGNGTDTTELSNIASTRGTNRSLVYQVGDYEALQKLNSTVAYVACGAEPLPMNITRFTPAPTLPSPTPSSDCFDTISDCRKYTKAACSDYKPWARAHCSAYCGFCDSSVTTTKRPCVNTIANCHEYGTYICTSVSLTAWTLDHCALYCGFCGNGTRPTEPQASPTPITTPTAVPGKCTNLIANCDEYGGKEMCKQETYKAWAKQHCQEYCGYCTNSRIVTSKPLSNVTCPTWKLPLECSLVYYNNSCCPLPSCPPGYILTAEAPHL